MKKVIFLVLITGVLFGANNQYITKEIELNKTLVNNENAFKEFKEGIKFFEKATGSKINISQTKSKAIIQSEDNSSLESVKKYILDTNKFYSRNMLVEVHIIELNIYDKYKNLLYFDDKLNDIVNDYKEYVRANKIMDKNYLKAFFSNYGEVDIRRIEAICDNGVRKNIKTDNTSLNIRLMTHDGYKIFSSLILSSKFKTKKYSFSAHPVLENQEMHKIQKIGSDNQIIMTLIKVDVNNN